MWTLFDRKVEKFWGPNLSERDSKGIVTSELYKPLSNNANGSYDP